MTPLDRINAYTAHRMGIMTKEERDARLAEDNWPKHPDGTNKTIGEMPEEDRKRIMREAAARYKAKGGEAHAKLADIIDRKWGGSDGL